MCWSARETLLRVIQTLSRRKKVAAARKYAKVAHKPSKTQIQGTMSAVGAVKNRQKRAIFAPISGFS